MISKTKFFRSVGYKPHPVQKLVHDSKARFRVVAAGSRGGKSIIGGVELATGLLMPDFRAWCISTQYDLADKVFDWCLFYLDRFRYKGKRLLNLARIISASRGSRSIEFPWGSFCRTKSTEKPTSLLGEELDFAVIDEASQIPRSSWEGMIRARLGSRSGKALIISTPNSDGGFFKSTFEKGQDPAERDWASWQFSVAENPFFPPEEFEIARQELSKDVFDEQYRGLFVSRRGKVFSTFSDENLTIKDHREIWPVMVGIHYQANNPCAIVFVTRDPETKDYLVYDEIYEEKSPLALVEEIKAKVRGKLFLGVFLDFHDQALQKEMRMSGFQVAINRKEKGVSKKVSLVKRVEAIQSAIKNREDLPPRLLINRRCLNTIIDFQKAKWPDKRKEEEEKHEKEVPLTKYIFLPVAISYIVSFCEAISGVDLYAG